MTTTTKSRLPIKPVGSIDRVSSFAIYGRAGSGKTTLASTFPKPLLLLDINDRGTDSISDVKGVDVMEIKTEDDLEDVYYFLKEGKHKYRTVVFDTITELQKIIVNAVGSNKKNKEAGDWGSMTRKQWGEVSGTMNKWISDFRDLPLETVFIAQERVRGSGDEEGDDNQITPEVGPAVMPSIATTLNAAVNVVGNCFIRSRRKTKEVRGKKVVKEEMVYCLRVGPNPVYITKIRKPRKTEAPGYVEDPTFEDIMAIVKGEE